jgi:hypothetical protein
MMVQLTKAWCALVPALALLPVQASAQANASEPAQDPAASAKPTATASVEGGAFTFVKNEASDESVYDFNYSSPESPVLPLIGVEGDQIARVDSLRTFGINVGNSFGLGDQAGAVAIDFSPYWALAGDDVTLSQYRGDGESGGLSNLQRYLARSKIGLAFSTGDEATGQPSSFVASFGIKLLDQSDKLLSTDFDKCIKDKLSPLNQQILREIAEAEDSSLGNGLVNVPQARKDQINKLYDECAKVAGRAIAGAGFVDVGVGHRMTGDPGDIDNLKSAGTLVWATAGTGQVFGKKDQGGARAVAHARFTFDDSLFDDSFVLQGERDSIQLVAGIESIPNPSKPERFRWSLQGGWTKQNAVLPVEEDRNFWRYQANLTLRVSDSVWLVGTLGRVSGEGVEDDTMALIGISFTPPSNASIFD